MSQTVEICLAQNAVHSRAQLRNAGRMIYLESLDQSQISAGLLEGLPTVEMNRRIIDAARERETQRLIYGVTAAVSVVLAPQGPVALDNPYPFGDPMTLPPVGCVGRFTSLDSARDRSKDGSALTLIWFQDQFALPIAPEALGAIVAVDWNALANDIEY